MPSLLCLTAVVGGGWVGRTTVRGGVVIDVFGDAIMNCKHLRGDTWRQRHDTGKLAIVNECVNAGLRHDCEVYGLFADLIPAQAMARDKNYNGGGKGSLPTPQGLIDYLAELKLSGHSVRQHTHNVRAHALRSDQKFQTDYVDK